MIHTSTSCTVGQTYRLMRASYVRLLLLYEQVRIIEYGLISNEERLGLGTKGGLYR